MIEYILNEQAIEALGWTLLHSIWQGAVFAILLVLILILLRRYSAQSRYVVAVGMLAAFFLTVSATFWHQWKEAGYRLDAPETLAQSLQHADDVARIESSTAEISKSVVSEMQINNDVAIADNSNWVTTFRDYYQSHLPLLVTVWFLAVLFLQLRFLGQLAYVQRLKHYGTELLPESWSNKIEELEGKLRIQKKVSYLTSLRIESPMVIGWLKPVVLLPRQLVKSFSETEVYAILAHELAHIRREDFIVNLLQTFLCNIFFFHPGVWWMSNRVDDEREHCCDDLAVAATGPANSYAKTLINVSELQLRMQQSTNLAMGFSGKASRRKRGSFADRIRRLFTVKTGEGSFREGFATACILITALFLGMIATGHTVQDRDSVSVQNSDKTERTVEEGDASIRSSDKNLEGNSTDIMDQSGTVNSIISNPNELPVAEPVQPAFAVYPDETRIDALVMACEEGDLKFVKTIVKSGIDVNSVGSKGFTPLVIATSENNAEIVKYLIKNGADVNQSMNGWTALMEAADEGSLKSMEYLLHAGADVNYYSKRNGSSALSMASGEGKLKCLQLLLEFEADINGIRESIPPLHAAAKEGRESILDFLLAQNANINQRDANGRTALMYAASEGNKQIILKLIRAGANLSIGDMNGLTAANYAQEEGEYEIQDYLETELRGRLKRSQNDLDNLSNTLNDKDQMLGEEHGIHQATLDGLIEKVQQMVEEGTYVDLPDDYGRTPLHIASAANHNIDMRILIDLGANINAQDEQGRTPLMYAAADGKANAVSLLISEGANTGIKDMDGMRAYEWGQASGNIELAKFIRLVTQNDKNQYKSKQKTKEKLAKTKIHRDIDKRETFHVYESGSHLRQYNIEEIPSLMKAVQAGNEEECHRLLKSGISANSADGTGQTALMVAARNGRLEIAWLLIEYRADVNMSSASGLTALHYAALEDHHNLAKLLLKNGAKVDAPMRYSSTDGNYDNVPRVWEYIGATPLLIAVESNNINVIATLMEAGANPNRTLTRKEYVLSENRASYLTGSEVMGIDDEFLNNLEVVISDEKWTPYRQAVLLDEPAIFALLKN